MADEPSRHNPDDLPIKIFIKDIHEALRDEDDTNYFFFNGLRIRKVDVMGVVTEVKNIGDFHVYRVDDGTADIMCRFNHHSPSKMEQHAVIEDLQETVASLNFVNISESGAAMEQILEEVYHISHQHLNPFAQGDCVHLLGFIGSFRGNQVINTYVMNKVSDPAHEVDRIFELSSLYSKIYPKTGE